MAVGPHEIKTSITPAQWQEVKDIFDRALDANITALPPAEHHAFIASLTQDPSVISEVDRLLAHWDGADTFIEEASRTIFEAATAPAFEEGDLLANRYLIKRFIARGGMGEVYEAEDKTLSGVVALKILSPSLAYNPRLEARFRKEIQLSRNINSPYVCRVHDIGYHEDNDGAKTTFYTMELLEGETLAARLKAKGKFTLEEARPLIHDMALGLDAAHKLGVLHRDFKPSNVMLTPKGAVITDFGLAQELNAGTDGVNAATVEYAAPEQLAGTSQTTKTDIYSFGLVVKNMLSGNTSSFCGPEVPAGVKQSLSAAPSARPESAIILAENLGAIENRTQRSQNRRTFLLTGGAVAVAATGGYSIARRTSTSPPPSLAVLPFKATSPSLTEIAGGLADSLIASLTRTGSIRVIAPFSALQERGPNRDFGAIAKKLAVDTFLTGLLDDTASSLGIVAQLINVNTGRELWKSKFSASPGALFQVQQEITEAVLSQFGIRAPHENSSSPRGEAHELYLRGRYFWNKRDPDNLRRALDCFQKATAIQADYAEAWAGVSDSYHLLAGSLVPTKEATVRAKEAAARAVQLNPRLAEGHLSSAILTQRVDWDWQVAGQGFRTALDLAPGNARAHHWYAGLLSDTGDSARAIEEIDIARKLDPLSFAVSTAAAMYRYVARQFEEAIQIGNLVKDVEPNYFRIYPFLAASSLELGRRAEALDYYEQGLRMAPADPYMQAHATYAHFRAGDRSRAIQLLQALLNRIVPPPPFYVALAYCGDADRLNAVHWLTRGFEERDPSMTMIKVHPALDPVRGEPAFRDLLRKMKLE